MTPLPNFIIAGVPKAGTTSLYGYLGQHPQIFLSPIKEPTFFGADEFIARSSPEARAIIARREREIREQLERGGRLSADFGLVRDWDTYLRLFANAGTRPAIGEASVSYFWLPGAAAQIRERLPHTRIIVMLRDPADRLFSHYLSSAWHQPGASFRERFEAGLEPGDDWQPALDVGRYATHLQRFFAAFPPPQRSIHLYEEYASDPPRVLRSLFAFLAVNPDQRVDVSRRERAPAVPRYPRLHALRQQLLGGGPLLGRWMPEGLKRAIRRVYHRPRAEVRMSPDDRRMVVDYYREEILRTADLIGRDLSAWLR
jgi:hypothetical protein